MKNRLTYLSLLIVLFFPWSCVPVHESSTVWVNPDASFSKYKTITVDNFTNSTDKKSSEYDITGKLTNLLKSNLANKRFVLVSAGEKPDNNLIVKCDIVYFEPGSAFERWFGGGMFGGAIQLSIRTTLIDETSNNVLSDFLTDAEILGYAPTVDQDEQILANVAERIANGINKLLKQ